MMASTKARSFTKALSWRALSTIITTGFVWLLTGKVSFALAVLAFDVTVMTLVYYVHERIWKSIVWGKYPTDWTKYGWERKAEGEGQPPGEASAEDELEDSREDHSRHPIF